ncbi:MAG: hypothetical protein OEW39_14580, partial [Deltaproteobacteria bacterium]|nr:hypothetical protein [Deltaproteobacteria bacterium]
VATPAGPGPVWINQFDPATDTALAALRVDFNALTAGTDYAYEALESHGQAAIEIHLINTAATLAAISGGTAVWAVDPVDGLTKATLESQLGTITTTWTDAATATRPLNGIVDSGEFTAYFDSAVSCTADFTAYVKNTNKTCGKELVKLGWNTFMLHGDASPSGSKGVHNPAFFTRVFYATKDRLTKLLGL